MSLLDDYRRVTRSRPCPVCDHGGWCLVSREGGDDPVSAICPRVESDSFWGTSGYFHPLRDARRPRKRQTAWPIPLLPPDHRREAERLARQAGPYLSELAGSLGVTEDALRRLGVGWHRDENCSTWPEWDGRGRVVGILRRFTDGRKMTRAGDRCGLFMPHDLPASLRGKDLVVAEGGSDCAAALSMGLWAVGRHSCLSGTPEVTRVARSVRPCRLIVVGDNDRGGQGSMGARRIAGLLSRVAPVVVFVLPPPAHKDLRQWRQAGAEASDLLARVGVDR